MIQAIQQAAHQTIERHGILRLSARDQQVFVKALLKPPEPGKRLRAAAERYKNLNCREAVLNPVAVRNCLIPPDDRAT